MLKFYHSLDSCAIASYIALEEVGACYESVVMDLRKSHQTTPEYLAVNPKGRVPSLKTEQGVLTETPAILAYIAQSFPDSVLALPADPFVFAQMQAFNCYIVATLHVAHSLKFRGSRWADDPAAIAEMRRKVPETVGACYAFIERNLFKGPWVMGDTYTICDPYLFTFEQWMESDGVDPAAYPAIAAHRERMKMRPAVQKLLEAQRAQN